MRILIWTVAGLAAALWSTFAWLACRLIELGGALASEGLTGLHLTLTATNVLSTVAATGFEAAAWLIAGLWLAVMLLIALFGLIIDGSVPRKARIVPTGS
jgi:hypothetical protein